MSIPPFQINNEIVALLAKIMNCLGKMEGFQLDLKQPKLRKENRIRTIHASLAIEGNTLSMEQISTLLDGKRVIANPTELQEVKNAIATYEALPQLRSKSEKDFLKAHKLMLNKILPEAGKYRSKGVGIFKGNHISHMAPPAKQVPMAMQNLFQWVKKNKELHPLIISAVVHYEIEFIHPFSDGNGRMGRLWQSLILAEFHPVFRFTPFENIIQKNQKEYYKALEISDKIGSSENFVSFSLQCILESIEETVQSLEPSPLTMDRRLELAREHFHKKEFSRKEYMNFLKTLSSATASRDLAYGTKKKLLKKSGSQAQTKYLFTDIKISSV